jgi:hypothetical protein
VEGLGEVRHLVAPNSLHHLFVGDWRDANPLAGLCVAPDLSLRWKDLQLAA